MKKNYILSIALFLVGFFGFSQSYLDGILVLNEGNFGSETASVSFMNAENEVTQNIFGLANNNAPLGDVAQSMSVNGDNAYIILNASSTIKVVDYETFELSATISEGLKFPRYMVVYQNKGYVTCWGKGDDTTDDYIAIIDLDKNDVESTIPMAEGVERIELINGKLYVAHTGGYGYGTTISVVEPEAPYAVTSIEVGDLPGDMIVKDNFLYVLCRGLPSWSGQEETTGKLVKIDLTDNSVVSSLSFSDITHPGHLATYGDNLYYTVGPDVFKIAFTATAFPTTPFISTSMTDYLGIYGLDFIDDKIYIADSNNYASNGFALIYDLSGNLLSKNPVELLPNHFYKSKQSVLGLNKNTFASLSLYPNPATHQFFINTDKNVGVKIYDLTGKLLRNETYSMSGIDVSNLSKGIYIVEMDVNNAKSTSKLIIK